MILYLFFRSLIPSTIGLLQTDENLTDITIIHERSMAFSTFPMQNYSQAANSFLNFAVLKKCQGKMDCLVYQMFLVKKYRSSHNSQSDSIRAEVFVHQLRTIDYCFLAQFRLPTYVNILHFLDNDDSIIEICPRQFF